MAISKKKRTESLHTRRKVMERHAGSVWKSLLEDPILKTDGIDKKTRSNLIDLRRLKLSPTDIEEGFRFYVEMSPEEQIKGLTRASKYVGTKKARNLLATACDIIKVKDFHSHSVLFKTPLPIQAELESLIHAPKSERLKRLKGKTNVEVLELLLHLARVIGSLKAEKVRFIIGIKYMAGFYLLLLMSFCIGILIGIIQKKIEGDGRIKAEVERWMTGVSDSQNLTTTECSVTLQISDGTFKMSWKKWRFGIRNLEFEWNDKKDTSKNYNSGNFYVPECLTDNLFSKYNVFGAGRNPVENLYIRHFLNKLPDSELDSSAAPEDKPRT
jgi:hypothetical protein